MTALCTIFATLLEVQNYSKMKSLFKKITIGLRYGQIQFISSGSRRRSNRCNLKVTDFSFTWEKNDLVFCSVVYQMTSSKAGEPVPLEVLKQRLEFRVMVRGATHGVEVWVGVRWSPRSFPKPRCSEPRKEVRGAQPSVSKDSSCPSRSTRGRKKPSQPGGRGWDTPLSAARVPDEAEGHVHRGLQLLPGDAPGGPRHPLCFPVRTHCQRSVSPAFRRHRS